jgi:hypothetical protein
MVEVMGVVLVLVYVEHGSDVRAMSLRRASKQERKRYAASNKTDWERVQHGAAADEPIAQSAGDPLRP